MMGSMQSPVSGLARFFDGAKAKLEETGGKTVADLEVATETVEKEAPAAPVAEKAPEKAEESAPEAPKKEEAPAEEAPKAEKAPEKEAPAEEATTEKSPAKEEKTEAPAKAESK